MNKTTYGIILMKKDGDHIIIDCEGYDRSYKKWSYYKDEWTRSLLEHKPLVIIEQEQGLIKAFDPALVFEISLRKKELNIKKEENPYYGDMLNKGFSESYKENTSNSTDLLDRGYK